MARPIINRVRELRAGQSSRIADFLATARAFFRPMLDPVRADWTIDLTQESGRLDMQLAVAFLESDDPADQRLGNCLVRRAPLTSFPAGHRFDIFQTSIAAHFLVRYEARLEAATLGHCEQLVREGCPNSPGMSSPDYQFHGYNDNMPAMTCKTLVLGGERFGQADWLETGLHRLAQAAEMLGRRGLVSEFNSPNYLPDTINALEMIAQYARTPEARELAGQILPRLWLDAAAHWHPQGRGQAGPHSRAYGADFLNHLSPMKALVWYLLGAEVSGLTPHEACDPRPGLLLMHCGDQLEHTVRCVWYAGSDYRSLTHDTAALFLEKPDPFELVATAELGDDEAHPVRRTVCTTWMRPDYSLGTCSAAFCGGEQTSQLFVTAASQADAPPVAGIKYLVDEHQPGNRRTMDWHVPREGEDWVISQGEAVAVQHQGSALYWSEPQLKLADNEISRMRLAFIISSAFESPAELIVGGRNIARWEGEFPADRWIGIRLGQALIALRPLAENLLPIEPPRLVLQRCRTNHWLEIVNYDGPGRVFSQADLVCLQNGLVVETAAAADYPSLGAFVAELEGRTRLQDILVLRTRRMRYRREAMADREAVLLTVNASVWHGTGLTSVNGAEPGHTPWQCTGIPADSLPLLGPGQIRVSDKSLPWRDDLSVHWYPDEPWAIIETDVESATAGSN